MIEFILAIHLMLAIALIGVVLLQRSEGGGLGIGGGGGGGGGMGGFLTGRGTKNLLTTTTACLAAAFMVTSLGLTWLESRQSGPGSIIDTLPITAPSTTTGTHSGTTEPAAPTEPVVPVQ